jgi:hypothetical protein
VMLQIIKFSLLCLPPCEIFLATTLGHLAEGPCNMGESQHEPSVEVGKSQEEQCIPSIGPCSCQRIIFPSWHIACVAAECSKPVEYVACAPPKFC